MFVEGRRQNAFDKTTSKGGYLTTTYSLLFFWGAQHSPVTLRGGGELRGGGAEPRGREGGAKVMGNGHPAQPNQLRFN